MAMQAGYIAGIVVRDAVLPAAEGDADPLESQRPDRRVVVFAAAFLLLIVEARPLAECDRMAGPCVERLAEKLRTSPAEVNPFGLAAPLHNWCDATEFRHLAGRGIAIAQRTESGQEARGQGRTGTGERVEDRKIGVCPGGLPDLLFQLVDALAQGSDSLHQDLGHPHRGLDHGYVAGRAFCKSSSVGQRSKSAPTNLAGRMWRSG